jgi:transposase
LFTRNGKGLTAKGIKPICTFQQVFKSLYLFGAFSPITGDHFELEMPYCNTDTFQIFLDEFSKNSPDEFIVLLLDNGAFHKAQKLIIPKNIALLFIPPYSPELNPAEKIWWKMKRSFSGKLHKTLNRVSEFIRNEVIIITNEQVKNTCRYEYIFSFPFWTNSY